jgi:hypothetical protein
MQPSTGNNYWGRIGAEVAGVASELESGILFVAALVLAGGVGISTELLPVGAMAEAALV